jgi:hypothetical protein
MKHKTCKSFSSKKQISDFARNIPSDISPDSYYKIYLNIFNIINTPQRKIYFHRIFSIKIKSLCLQKDIIKEIDRYLINYIKKIIKNKNKQNIFNYLTKIEKRKIKKENPKNYTFSYTQTPVTPEQVAQQNIKYYKRVSNVNKSRPKSYLKIIYTGMTN